MIIDGCLTDKESLYVLLTKDAIITENLDAYLKNMIAFYDEALLHVVFSLYIDDLEKNILDKEKDVIINKVQLMVANKKVDDVMKRWQVCLNSIRSRYGKRYLLARDRFSCYLSALCMGRDSDLEYQNFVNDIIKILNITPKNQLWGYRARIRSIFNKWQRKENK